MRFGAPRHLAVLASLSLLVSGQLCMLTTCVPRLREAGAASVHACCRTDPTQGAAASSEPARPSAPRGSMPCDQFSSFADAPTLPAPEPLACVPAGDLETAPAPATPPVLERMVREHDAGPLPGRDGPATAGLRAPPLA
jgi:hypothetical protein